MKVKMLHGAYAGEIQECPYHVATNLIQGGFAEEVREEVEEAPVEAPQEPEVAAIEQPKTAMVKPAKKKGKK